jgi:hypothetical protein
MIRTCRHMFLTALAALLAIGVAVPGADAWPGRNGAIVFEAYTPRPEERGEGEGIRVAPLGAGRSQIRALSEDAGDNDPQVSPTGAWSSSPAIPTRLNRLATRPRLSMWSASTALDFGRSPTAATPTVNRPSRHRAGGSSSPDAATSSR